MIHVYLIVSLLFAKIDSTQSDIAYYQVITDNNLFRPLGWTKPDLTPKFELIGTIVGEDFARAYVKNIGRNRLLVVSAGDSLGDDVVDKITNENVIMKSGKSYVGNGLSFLSSGSNKRKRTVARSQQTSNDTTRTTRTSKSGSTESTERVQGRSRGQERSQWEGQVQRFQTATPEERSRMIEEFRSMRGNRGGGRGRRRN
jgi:hypothetical protein